MIASARSTTLVLGAGGGVAWAFFALLDRDAILRGRALERRWVLVDRGARPPGFAAATAFLSPLECWHCDVRNEHDLEALVRAHAVDEVLDLAGIDTYALIGCADRCGARSIGTCFETEFEPAPPTAPHERALTAATALLPHLRPRELSHPHVLCAGMNPGLIELVALEAVERFCADADSVHVAQSHGEIDCVLLTEHDASHGPEDGHTWSPHHCDLEVREPVAGWALNGTPVWQTHAVIGESYRARCGALEIDGWLVPHDEVITLSQRLPGIAVAYLYQLSPRVRSKYLQSSAAERQDGEGKDEGKTEERGGTDYDVARAYPPWGSVPAGHNRVGALVVSQARGELWLGWTTAHEVAAALGTNAIQLQVAVGVASVWEVLGELSPGAHCVGELDRVSLLRRASEHLGPLEVVRDPDASFRSLADRRARAK